MAVLARANDALVINPPAGDNYLSDHGSNWLWAVTAVYVVSFLAFVGLTFIARSGEKIFHYLFTIALLIGSIAYFAQASDLGWSVVPTANVLEYGLTRQIFFAKYIHWVVAFPAIVVALGLLSGVAWATIFYHVFLAWTWVVAYLASAYTTTNYKWGFFAFGTTAWILLAVGTLLDGRRAAGRVEVGRDYGLLAGWVNLLWLLYPIAFGLTDGGNRIGVTAGFIFTGVLDVLLVPVVAVAFLALSRRWDYGRLNIAFTQYGRVRQGGAFPEKEAAPRGGPVVEPAA